MDTATLQQIFEHWAQLFLTWIGFGTLVGLLAKAIMPGRDPGGAVATLAMGIGGTVIGLGTLSLAWRDSKVTPISPLGFLVATAGAFVLLFFYRLLGGRFFVEGRDAPEREIILRRSGNRRQSDKVIRID